LSARHTLFFRCIIALPLCTDLAIGLSIQGFLVLMLYVCVVVFWMLHAASALLLVVIVLTAHYRAPLCVVVSVLYISCMLTVCTLKLRLEAVCFAS
jgi:hypothetical protein